MPGKRRQDRNQVRDLWLSGMSKRSITQALSCSMPYVYDVLNEYGIAHMGVQRKRKQRKKLEVHERVGYAVVVRDYEKGLPYHKIAANAHISIQQVANIVRLAKLTKRPRPRRTTLNGE